MLRYGDKLVGKHCRRLGMRSGDYAKQYIKISHGRTDKAIFALEYLIDRCVVALVFAKRDQHAVSDRRLYILVAEKTARTAKDILSVDVGGVKSAADRYKFSLKSTVNDRFPPITDYLPNYFITKKSKLQE